MSFDLPALTEPAIEAAAEAAWATFHDLLRQSNPRMPPRRSWSQEDLPVRALYRGMVVAAHAALTAFAAKSASDGSAAASTGGSP